MILTGGKRTKRFSVGISWVLFFFREAILSEEEFHKGGMLIVPKNFTIDDLIKYMQCNLDIVRLARNQFRKNIKESKNLKRQIEYNLINLAEVTSENLILPFYVCH